MKQFMTKTIIAFLTLIIVGGHMASMADQYVNEEAAVKGKLLKMKTYYTSITQKEPTTENLRKSITIQNAHGEKAEEVITALDLITPENKELESVTKDILSCYDRNSDNQLIQNVCADALLRIDKPRGVDLSCKILADTKMKLETRLRAARSLVSAKVLFGYPVLREGLTTHDDYQRTRLALPLLEAFFPYDGAVYGEQGEKIDIHALIADAKKNTKDQKIIDDLEKAELKYSNKLNR